MDPAHFQDIIQRLTNPDNELRKAAEADLDAAKQHHGPWVLQALAHIVSNEAPQEVHGVALTVLRKMFAKEDKSYDSEAPEVQESIKVSVVAAFTALAHGPWMSSVAACVAALAAKIYFMQRTWNDLWGNLFHTIQDPTAHPKLRAASCEVLASCAGVLEPYLRNHHSELAHGLVLCVQQEETTLKRSAVYTLTELLNTINAKQLQPFCAIPGHILQSVETSLNTGDNDTAVVLLSNVCELVEGSPALFKTMSEPFLRACMQIASTPQVDSGVRHVAVEVMITMCSHNTKVTKKIPGFATSLFDLMYSYSLNPTVEANWDTTDDVESAEAEGNSDFDIGVTGMDRICCALGPKALAEHVQQVVAANIGSDSWNHRQAAVSILTYTMEGLKAAFENHLDYAVGLVINLANDQNKVVRCAVFQCISQLCTDFAPKIQETLHAKILPVLIAGLDDPIPRVHAGAAAAINAFYDEAENGDDDDMSVANMLSGYVQTIAGKLAHMVSTTSLNFVRSTALQALSGLIATSKTHVAPFIGDLVPIFQTILAMDEPPTPAEEHAVRMLKCRALECTTLLAGVTKYENFAAYATPVCDYLCQLLSQNLSTDDPRLTYVLRGWTNMVDCMGPHMVPYLPSMMPPLLALANLDCDLEVCTRNVGDAEDDEEEEGVEKMLMVLPGKGEVLVKTKTGLIEDKTIAVQIVCEIVRGLGANLGNWLPEIAKVGASLLGFCAASDIRALGAELLEALIPAYAECAPAEVPNFTSTVLLALMETIRTEREFSLINNFLESIATLAKTNGQFFPVEHLSKLAAIIRAACNEAGKRKAENLKEKGQFGESDDEDEEIDAAIEEDDELLSDCNSASDRILQSCPAFTPHFEEHILPLAGEMINTDNNSNCVIGIGFLSGYAEFGADCAAAKHLGSIIPPIFHFITSAESDLAHSAFNCMRAVIILCAKAFPPTDENALDFVQTALTRINAFLATQNAHNANWSSVSCNAISAGVAALQHYTPQLNADAQKQLIQHVVAYLPLDDMDEVEARSVHRRVLQLRGHPAIPEDLFVTLVHKIKSANPETLDAETVEHLKTFVM